MLCAIRNVNTFAGVLVEVCIYQTTIQRNMNKTDANITDVGSDLSQSSDSIEEDTPTMTILVNSSVVVVSLIVIVLNSAAIHTLFKCRRMPFQIKWLSSNLILTDIFLHVFLVCLCACVVRLGKPFLDKIFYLRVVVGGIMALVSLASVCSLIFERLLALTKTMSYTKLLTKTKVALLLVYIWLPHTILPFTIFAFTVYRTCDFDFSLRQCNSWLALLYYRLSIAGIFAIYHSFIIYAYVIILKILHRHVKSITRQTHVSTIEKTNSKKNKKTSIDTTTHRIIRIVLTFELINLPIFTHSLIFAFLPAFQGSSIEIVFQTLSYVCSCSNSLINLYLYVWKMKECRLVFLNTFFSWSQRCRGMALGLKREVYPFVVHSKSACETMSKTYKDSANM